MRMKLWMLLAIVILVMVPCLAFGQTDPPQPPVCCNQEDPPPPPPPPGGNFAMIGGAVLNLTPQFTVSDTDLANLGVTRTQFLNSLAALLFPTAGSNVAVVIPVLVPSGDPTIPDQVVNYRFAIGQVGDNILDAVTWLYLTNGTRSVVVIFDANAGSPSN